ncbi:hypothetical protein AAMO2058_001741900 [Amorphochlora amoebiformis]
MVILWALAALLAANGQPRSGLSITFRASHASSPRLDTCLSRSRSFSRRVSVISSGVCERNQRRNKRRIELPTAVSGSEAEKAGMMSRLMSRVNPVDRKIVALTLPAMLNIMLLPLVGLVDTYWVGKMGDAVKLAGQSAANQVFSTASWFVAFLPSVTTPLIAKAYASGDRNAAANRIAEAVFVAVGVGLFGMLGLQLFPLLALSIVADPQAVFIQPAKDYLTWRSISFIPAMFATIGFAAFRGKMDTTTPLKISLVANVINCGLDPILIFKCGMGVVGAAAATVVSEFFSAAAFLFFLLKRNMVKLTEIFRLPKWKSLKPLLQGGVAVQTRSMLMQLALLSATRSANLLDTTGVSAAAYQLTVIFWQLGATVMLALSTTSSIMVSASQGSAKAAGVSDSSDSVAATRSVADRMMAWGLGSGLVLGLAQLLSVPLISKFSPIEEVNNAAKSAAGLVAFSQFLNGIVFTGEGVMQGLGCFKALASIATVLARWQDEKILRNKVIALRQPLLDRFHPLHCDHER